MAEEKGGGGDHEEAPPFFIWLRKLLPSMPSNSSFLKKLTLRLPRFSNNASPPPLLPLSIPSSSSNTDLHPIIQNLREYELGKLVFKLALPITILLLFFTVSNGNSHFSAVKGNLQKLVAAHFVLVGLMAGSVAIWNGLLFRKKFSNFANILEQFGISPVLLFIHGLDVASFVPKAFSWVIWVSGVSSLIPFIYVCINRQTAAGG